MPLSVSILYDVFNCYYYYYYLYWVFNVVYVYYILILSIQFHYTFEILYTWILAWVFQQENLLSETRFSRIRQTTIQRMLSTRLPEYSTYATQLEAPNTSSFIVKRRHKVSASQLHVKTDPTTSPNDCRISASWARGGALEIIICSSSSLYDSIAKKMTNMVSADRRVQCSDTSNIIMDSIDFFKWFHVRSLL